MIHPMSRCVPVRSPSESLGFVGASLSRAKSVDASGSSSASGSSGSIGSAASEESKNTTESVDVKIGLATSSAPAGRWSSRRGRGARGGAGGPGEAPRAGRRRWASSAASISSRNAAIKGRRSGFHSSALCTTPASSGGTSLRTSKSRGIGLGSDAFKDVFVLAFKGAMAREQFEKDDAHRPDVGARVDLGAADHLLGRHIRGRPEDLPDDRACAHAREARELRDAEINELGEDGAGRRPREHHVLRLDIPMNDVRLVGRDEARS